jgi:alpha-mannosidase
MTKNIIILVFTFVFTLNLFGKPGLSKTVHGIKTSAVSTIPLVLMKADEKIPKDTIHVMGHSHMDMCWLWGYEETMQMCQDNLRQTVAFMDEIPDFRMSQSQAVVFDFVKKADPPLFEKVKKYVKEGRLELLGGKWTEGDENLSSGEAIARSYLIGQRFFMENFGKTAVVGWLPDNFGHVSQGPQILNLAGCKYFYQHRCKPYLGTYWWVGSDSSKVLAYANHTYNGDLTPGIKNDFTKLIPDKHRLFFSMGVGDHGGGPTRANIETMQKLNKTEDFPTLIFSSAERFFNAASKEMNGRPTHCGEMGFICDGCYTTVADIKEGNRSCENALFNCEFFNTLGWLHGDKYPGNELNELWKMLTFNQFHDILPGSGINQSNKENIARYYEVLRKTNELTKLAFRKVADEVKFQKGIGTPIVAFNLIPNKRKAIVQADVYSNEEPASVELINWASWMSDIVPRSIKPKKTANGNVASILVKDGSGKTYPAQIVWGKITPPGFTSRVQFIVDHMPAGGYKTFYVDVTKPGNDNSSIPMTSDNTFETDFFNVKFDMSTGNIISLYDKSLNKEFVKKGEQLNTLKMYKEDKNGPMKAWFINKIVSQDKVTDVKSVKITENGPVRACVEATKKWGKSTFKIKTYIYKSYPRITYDLDVSWLETGDQQNDSPMLRAVFPIEIENPGFFCQVPFDVAKRPIDFKLDGKDAPNTLRQTWLYGEILPDKGDGIEVPAQKWVDLSDGKVGMALLNNSKYGHSVHDGELRLTLMRAGGEPDVFPNIGKFHISYALYPHSRDWKDGVWAEGDDFNVPVYAAEPPSLALAKNHSTRPEEESFFSVSPSNILMSGVKQSEDGKELIIRLFEIEGKETAATIDLQVKAKSVRRLNLIENPLINASKPGIQGNTIIVKMKPHEIVTLGIRQ